MKIKGLLLLLLSVQFGFSQLKIEKSDLRFEVGNQWNNLGYSTSGNVDTREGENITWDFTGMTGGFPDTTTVPLNDGSKVVVSSTTKGDITYNVEDTTYVLVSMLGLSLTPPLSTTIGLPHYYGKNWSGSGKIGGFIDVNVSGSVVGSGTIVSDLGTFDCLLIKEVFAAPANQTNYYWETKEHGRIAVYYESDKKLFVTQSDKKEEPVVTPITGIVIEKEHFNWGEGAVMNNLVYTKSATDVNAIAGDNLTWDFTGLSGGTADTGKVTLNDGSTVKITVSSKIEHWFKVVDTTYAYSYLEAQNVDEPNNTTIGLPHYYGKDWYCIGNYSLGVAQFNVQGNVIGRGKVTVPLGTFDCLLVKEELTGGLTGTNYYWETKEHGRVASHFGAQSQFVVLQSETKATNNSVQGLSAVSLNVFPNPTNSVLNVDADASDLKEIYTITGVKVLSTLSNSIDVSGLSNGTYVLRVNGQAVQFSKK